MNRDDVIRMARKAGIVFDDKAAPFYERFAALVAAAEREACAKLVEVSDDLADWEIVCGSDGRVLLNAMADAIRARGQT